MYTQVVSIKAGCRVWILNGNAMLSSKMNLDDPKFHMEIQIMYHIVTHLLEWRRAETDSAYKDVEWLEPSHILVGQALYF